MNKLIILPILIIIFFIFTIFYTPSEQKMNETAVVERVVDGDTFVLEDGTRVRLIGMDAPEKGQRCSAEATEFLKNLTEGKEAVLEKDLANKDYFGRLLRYVYVDGKFVNELIVKEGLAVSEIIEPNVKYQKEIKNAENAAIQEKGCVWR